MDNIEFKPAIELARLIRERKVSAVELLEAYIRRYEAYNPQLNAVIATDFKAAREKAKAADEALDKGENWGPLHGLPITIKDNLEVMGMRCTSGSVLFENHFPTKNAALVNSLLEAGAIIFGKTNLPETGSDFQTYNKIFGTTNNPWNLNRTAGGSSGGSAVAMAAALSAVEIGNDIGGSIRLPAAFCGVYGHKPSFGIVPDHGLVPPSPGIFEKDHCIEKDIVVNGPLARSAEDLQMMLDIIAGPEPPDRKAWKIQLPPARKQHLKEYKIGLWLDDPACAVDTAIGDKLQAAVDKLAKAGADVRDRKPEVNFRETYRIFALLLNAVQGAGAEPIIFDKWISREGGLSLEDQEYKSLQIQGAIQRHRDWLMVDGQRQLLREKWDDFFEEFDALLCPATFVPAFPHDYGSWFKRTLTVNGGKVPYTDIMGWAGLTNVVYLPSTIAPVGLTPDGLPVGMQIVAPYLEDRTSIHIAGLMADVCGGFTPPPDFS